MTDQPTVEQHEAAHSGCLPRGIPLYAIGAWVREMQSLPQRIPRASHISREVAPCKCRNITGL